MGGKVDGATVEVDDRQEGGGIGSGADVGDQFTVSQMAKNVQQLQQIENSMDIKVGFSPGRIPVFR